MARRVRHPLVSLAMFLVVCGMAYAVWENRAALKSTPAGQLLDRTTRDEIQDRVFTAFEDDDCFSGLRGNMNWRPNEQRYRLDIVVVDGAECEGRARSLCRQIAEMIREDTDIAATVIAFDASGREVGRCVL